MDDLRIDRRTVVEWLLVVVVVVTLFVVVYNGRQGDPNLTSSETIERYWERVEAKQKAESERRP